MGKFLSFLDGYKTYITGGAAILTAIGAYLNHAITLNEMVVAIFAAVQSMNIRHSITTTATATTGKPA